MRAAHVEAGDDALSFFQSSGFHQKGWPLAGKALRIIPVLDLKGGQVVRAEMGRRDRYRPIVTPLSASPDPVSVATGLRTLHPFSAFYIADLDAIEGRAPNAEALALLRAMPDAPELWVDAGIANGEALAAALAEPSLRPVLGSESQQSDALLRRFCDHPGLVLSLDFFADGFRGPPSILEEPAFWPQTVIVMTLAKVGSGAGPDFARLAEIKAKAGSRSVVAAGGVRNEADISALSSLGVDAALVATSLHDGTLTPRQLASLGAA
jgi:phosphoribosylformimino-5-aminoimidazole carboxamide ribotide isomerase